MRYFKYDGPWPDLEKEKESYKHFSQDMDRVNKRRNKLGNVVFWFVFALCASGLICLWFNILQFGDGLLDTIIGAIVFLLCVFLSLIASAILGVILASIFWNSGKPVYRMKMQQIMQDATEHLRDFYQFREPCLVTKCYRCSDSKWNRHDVCLFVVEDELRITTNLKNGFFHPEKDLGCYCFSKDEIAWKDGKFRDLPAIELEADGVCFLLSRNAIFYIRNFKDSR